MIPPRPFTGRGIFVIILSFWQRKGDKRHEDF